MKKFLSFFLAVVFALGIDSGCKKDKGDPPALPPAESMVIDFSNFVSQKKSVASIDEIKGVENSTWEFAALVAGYWRTLLNVTLAVPVASFVLATQNSPAYISEKTWQWSFNTSVTVNQSSSTYKARLTGQITATDVLWKMYVSKEGTDAFPEFLWFEGTSKPDASSGQWTLYHSPQFAEKVLQIDWTKSGSSVGSVKYTYVREQNNSRQTDPFRDSFIEYGRTNDPLNSFYNIHYFNGIAFSDVRVEWNSASREGRARSQSYFGTNNWYCWNSNFINVTCP